MKKPKRKIHRPIKKKRLKNRQQKKPEVPFETKALVNGFGSIMSDVADLIEDEDKQELNQFLKETTATIEKRNQKKRS